MTIGCAGAVRDEVPDFDGLSAQVRVFDVDAGVDDRDAHAPAGRPAVCARDPGVLERALQREVGIVPGAALVRLLELELLHPLHRLDPFVGVQPRDHVADRRAGLDLEHGAMDAEASHRPALDGLQAKIRCDGVQDLCDSRGRAGIGAGLAVRAAARAAQVQAVDVRVGDHHEDAPRSLLLRRVDAVPAQPASSATISTAARARRIHGAPDPGGVVTSRIRGSCLSAATIAARSASTGNASVTTPSSAGGPMAVRPWLVEQLTLFRSGDAGCEQDTQAHGRRIGGRRVGQRFIGVGRGGRRERPPPQQRGQRRRPSMRRGRTATTNPRRRRRSRRWTHRSHGSAPSGARTRDRWRPLRRSSR